MKRSTNWRTGFLACAVALLAACGGGDTGPAGPQGPKGDTGDTGATGPEGPQGPAGTATVTIPSNATPATDSFAATWAALAPKVTVTSVTVASPPVVKFSVVDGSGNPVVGLGNTSQGSTATKAGLTNLSFSIAKLVPGTNGGPSRWVSYIVTTVPAYKSATDKTVIGPFPQRPGTDNTGTLVDNKDGTYSYTFDRDITKIKDLVATLAANPGSSNSPYAAGQDKADLDDLTYDPTLVHRVTVQLGGSAPGTGTNTPTGAQTPGKPAVPVTQAFDAIYDFVPSTGAKAASGREIVATANCEQCHRKLGGIPGDDAESSAAGFHGGGRNNTQYCVVCHTAQRKFGQTEASINATTLTFTSAKVDVVDGRSVYNLPNFVHKIHMGEHLAKKGYNSNILLDEIKYPQDLRNCTKCHDGTSSITTSTKTAQGDNWKNAPNRLACGGCHDGVNFATGTGVTIADAAKGLTSSPFAHPAGPQPDDSLCALCHKPEVIDVQHLPVTPPNPANSLLAGGTNSNTNAAWIASNTSRLPAGAVKVSYDIKSVTLNSSRQPVMEFCIKLDGVCAALNTFDGTQPLAGQEILPNFMGSPSVYFVFSVPQDGIAAPADFNATASGYLRSLWNGTASGSGRGTLTGPDADGYYTATLTGVTIPTSAKMLTGGLGYSYSVINTLPLTQTNLTDYPVADATATSGLTTGMPNKTGGLIVIAPNAQKVATGFTGRRAIVEDARCNNCHQELGTFTEDAFHAGQRNDGTTCSWCHRPNQTSSGWSADSTSFIHGIHGGAMRSNAFTWQATSTTESFANVAYPGVLKDCETCHLPGSHYFFQQNNTPLSDDTMASRMYRTVGQGIYPAGGQTIPGWKVSGTACVAGTATVGTALSEFKLSPYVTKSTAAAVTNYGIGYSFNLGATTSNNCDPLGNFYTVAPGTSVEASGTTLVNSPIATACFACHDSRDAKAHMQANGGSIYAARSTALGTVETCMICHASGRIADIKVMHAK